MRSKPFLLAVGLSLALLSVAAIGASTLSLEEADLYAYSDPYEVYRGADGDVIVSDAGVGIWHVSATGVYTTYLLSADVLGARPDTGGDIWFMRDANGDGVAESIDHFLSLQVDGSESTGMIFNPTNPTQFIVSVQHPDSTDIPGGMGDALWEFDLSDVVPPPCDGAHGRYNRSCTNIEDFKFVDDLKKAGRKDAHDDHGRGRGRRWW